MKAYEAQRLRNCFQKSEFKKKKRNQKPVVKFWASALTVIDQMKKNFYCLVVSFFLFAVMAHIYMYVLVYIRQDSSKAQTRWQQVSQDL